MNVTFTPLDLAMADASVRRKRSMLVALIKPRAALSPAPTSAPNASPESAMATNQKIKNSQACAAMCSAAGRAAGSGGGGGAGDAEQCQAACVRGNGDDPHLAHLAATNHHSTWAEEEQDARTQGQGQAAGGRPVSSDLAWFPRRAAVLHDGSPHVKHTSWVRSPRVEIYRVLEFVPQGG
jgi:hypothetical protein